jgi:flagellar basal-body rod modification protein FlgD
MAAFAGILNHSLTAGSAQTGASPMAAAATGTSSSSSSSSSSATISANDFLTLLVTEMQNQDPTADTDPNEYINQLVSVNSLEQLIDINTTLTADSTSTTTTSSGTKTGVTNATAATAQVHGASQKASALAASQLAASNAAAAQASVFNHAPGNLSIPAANPAADLVGHALDGQSRTPSIPSGLPSVQ